MGLCGGLWIRPCIFRRLGAGGGTFELKVHLGMENCILGGVAGMDMLHEGRDVAVEGENAGSVESLDHLDAQFAISECMD